MSKKNYINYLNLIQNPKTTEEINHNLICYIVNDMMNGIFDTFGCDPQLEQYAKLCIANYKQLNIDWALQDYLYLNVKGFLELTR